MKKLRILINNNEVSEYNYVEVEDNIAESVVEKLHKSKIKADIVPDEPEPTGRYLYIIKSETNSPHPDMKMEFVGATTDFKEAANMFDTRCSLFINSLPNGFSEVSILNINGTDNVVGKLVSGKQYNMKIYIEKKELFKI